SGSTSPSRATRPGTSSSASTSSRWRAAPASLPCATRWRSNRLCDSRRSPPDGPRDRSDTRDRDGQGRRDLRGLAATVRQHQQLLEGDGQRACGARGVDDREPRCSHEVPQGRRSRLPAARAARDREDGEPERRPLLPRSQPGPRSRGRPDAGAGRRRRERLVPVEPAPRRASEARGRLGGGGDDVHGAGRRRALRRAEARVHRRADRRADRPVRDVELVEPPHGGAARRARAAGRAPQLLPSALGRRGRTMSSVAAQTQPAAADTGGARIEIEALAMHFGELRVFENIDLEVGRRECVSIVGPSGCGKTTLLRNIDGLLRPAEGVVRINGVPATSPPKGVAVVFQMFGLFPWKTVYENVAYGLRMAGAPKDQIREKVPYYVELVGLKGFEKA